MRRRRNRGVPNECSTWNSISRWKTAQIPKESTMKLSKRVTEQPPYLFAEIDRARDKAVERGLDVVSMGIADPDLPPPDWMYELLTEEIRHPGYHRYPDYKGLPEFLGATVQWMEERFGVMNLEPQTDAITLLGGKEGVAHVAWALCDPGDVALIPEPAYPVYSTNCLYAGAEVHFMGLTRENDFLPDLGAVPEDLAKRATVIYVNYPNNPTGACAPPEFYRDLLDFARKYDIAVLADNPYSEVYFDENERPHSILEFSGAKDLCLEFHSCSKTFNITGWRIGWAVGNAKLVEALLTVKSNVDSGQFNAIQHALARGLSHPERDTFLESNRKRIKERRDYVASELDTMEIWHPNPKATLYFWCGLPEGHEDGIRFASDLLQQEGFVVGPGLAYGPHGKDYFRLSLTAQENDIREGLARLTRFLGK
jgi:LL-diaminopimelate aminotransferase